MYQHGHGTCSAWAEPWTRMAQNCWRRDSNTDDQADLSDTQNSDPAGTATANDPSTVNARTCGHVLSESFKVSPSASSQLPAEQAPSLRSSSCRSPSSSPDSVSSDTADADPLEEMLVQQHLQRIGPLEEADFVRRSAGLHRHLALESQPKVAHEIFAELQHLLWVVADVLLAGILMLHHGDLWGAVAVLGLRHSPGSY